MFLAEEDLTLHITRGDAGEITVRAIDETTDGSETPYIFKAGEVLRLTVCEKKNCSNVVLQKDFPVLKDAETVTLALEEADTKIGDTISKPVDYWYEIELNPFTEPQTIVGYDEDGAKIFRLYPEGKDIEVIPPTPEEIGVIDKELDLTSERAIQNQAVARAVVQLESTVEKNNETATEGLAETNNKITSLDAELVVERNRITNLTTSMTSDSELLDARVGYNGEIHPSVGESIRTQVGDIENRFIKSDNLYNNETNTVGVVISSTGVETANAQFATTDYIFLNTGNYVMTYETLMKFSYMSIYDTTKTFKSRVDVTSGEITISEPCYVRFSGTKTRVTGIMLVEGTELPTEYVPYLIKLDNKYVNNISNDMLYDDSITMEKVKFINPSTNLINHMTITENTLVSATGEIQSVAENYLAVQYCITDKMFLEKSCEYTCNYVTRISYFKEDGTHIYSETTNFTVTSTSYTFTTRDDFGYVILTMENSATTNPNKLWQLNKGSELLPYEKQHLIIEGFRLFDDFDVVIDPIAEFKNKDRVVFDNAPLFTLSEDVDGINPTTQRNSASVFAMYDELLTQYPEYITKTELGADSLGNMLYRYDFNEPEQYHSENMPYSTSKPKAILISGIHNEFSGIYSLFHAMKQITTNPKLVDVKRNTHFIVVPVVNIYGVNNNQRKNENGIDLARNFEVGFIAGTNPDDFDYSGTTPLSELGCQHIDNLLRENKDAIFFNSCHSFSVGSNNEPKSFMWGCSATKYFCNLAKKVIDKLSREWGNKYDYITTSNGYITGNGINKYLGSADVSAPNGSESKQAMKYGIQGGSFEVCEYFHFINSTDVNTSACLSRGAETYINLILVNLYNYDSNF